VIDRIPVVSPMVRAKAAQAGPSGERWLAGLAGLIADLEQQWSVTVLEPLSGGSASYVARVRQQDGSDAVLKLAIPGIPEETKFAFQARTLEAARGRGYARLLASDLQRNALLLEALGPPMSRAALDPPRAIGLLCRVLREAWQVPLPAAATAVPREHKAAQLARVIAGLWQSEGRPCPEHVVALALEFARRRGEAFRPERCVVVHGDPHPGNALRVPSPRPGAECGFVFVDPDGFLAEPAYDLGVVLRDWCGELLAGNAARLAHGYCRLLADSAGVDEAAIWEWGFVERVSTGLYCLSLGQPDLGGPLLATAEMLT
jgi:streptomycin 6-kinase